jgi:hypothetical protein
LAKGANWLKVDKRVAGLLSQKQPRAFEVLKRFLRDEKTRAWDKYFILKLYQQHDVLEWTAKDLDDENDAVRICAAIVEFQARKSAKARAALGDALEKRGLEWWTLTAVEALLNEDSPESRAQALRLFKHRELPRQQTLLVEPSRRGSVMRRFADAGMIEPYQYYLKQLDDKELVPPGPGVSKTDKFAWGELHVAEIWREFGSGDATVREITQRFRTNSERIPDLKKWLAGKIARQP